jgi:arylformamidase
MSAHRQYPANNIPPFDDNSSPWIDISVPLHNNLVHWPGNPPFEMELVQSIKQGNAANLSKISMGAHSGTHVDAPYHFIQEGKDISSMPVDTMIGKARVIEIQDSRLIKPEELKVNNIQAGERILFKTRNSSRAWENNTFYEDFVAISKETADFLCEKGVKVVGVDYLSVGGYKNDGAYIHRTLLKAGIWLIEGLNLSEVIPGNYFLICLPLKIMSADGSPARAILRPTGLA